MFCAVQDPTSARVTILTVLAVGYALYHVLRWYAARPKVEKEEVKEKGEGEQRMDAHSTVQPPTQDPDSSPSPSPSPSPSHPTPLFTPDEIKRFEQMGRAAWSAGWLVEAHFWTTLARANGAHGLASRLTKMEGDWVARGCPSELENKHAGYMRANAALALAHLQYHCGLSQRKSADFLLAQVRKGSRIARSLARYERLIRD